MFATNQLARRAKIKKTTHLRKIATTLLLSVPKPLTPTLHANFCLFNLALEYVPVNASTMIY